jgi:prevent-host-death family protein
VTKTANIHEAKTQLSRLIEAALAGEEVIIQKAGKPAVRLVPIEAPKIERKPGAWKGKVWIADDFDDTPQDIIDLFYESEIFPKERD